MKHLLAFYALVVCACGGTPPTTGTPEAKAKAEVRDDSGARQGSDVDALWALAPKDTAVGIVVAPGTTLRLYDVAEHILRVIEARPVGADAMKEAREAMAELPFNIFDRGAFDISGIDLALGAAVFLDARENMTMILPVSDRQRFRTLAEGAEIQVSGRSLDSLDDDVFCAEKGSHYVCMQTAERLLTLLDAEASSFAERVYRLPSGYRGDIELIMDIPVFENMEGERNQYIREVISDPGLLAAVVQLGKGSMSARVWLQGKLRGEMRSVVEASKHVGALSDEVAALKPSGLLRMVLPMQMAGKEMPDETLPGGYSLKRDLLEAMTGEIVAYTPSSKTPWGRISLGITEATAFRSLLQMACTTIPPMDFLTIEKGDGRCDFTIDWDKVPNLDAETRALFHGTMLTSATVEDSQISLTIGHESPILPESQVSAIGRALLEQEWSYSIWTQNLSLISSLPRPWATVMQKQPPDMQEGMRYVLWLLAHVSELAVAASMQADGMHLMAHVGTYAADPNEAYQAYQVAVAKNIDVGDTKSDFAEIRRRWPDSQAAQQSAIASPFSVIIAELVASVSLPAMVNYARESKADEDPKSRPK